MNGSKTHPNRLWLVALLLIAAPTAAWADSEPPMVYFVVAYMLVGYGIIGLLEGFVLASILHLSKIRTMILLFTANYFANWGGGFFFARKIAAGMEPDISNVSQVLWTVVPIAYAMTLLCMLPFVLPAVAGPGRRAYKWIAIIAAIQIASYTVLLVTYHQPSATTLLTSVEVAPPAEVNLPDGLVVYYISEDDGDVYRMALDGSAPEKVLDLNSTIGRDRLMVQPSETTEKAWDILVRGDMGYLDDPEIATVREAAPVIAAPFPIDVEDYSSLDLDDVFPWDFAAEMVEADRTDWEFRTGYASKGLSARRKSTDKTDRVALDTIFVSWETNNVTHLPGDIALFQFNDSSLFWSGNGQICLFDPETWQIALLARGRGPVAVIERASKKQTDTEQTRATD